MGTRSLTRVIEGGKEIACIYRQFDGYPSGHGMELANFLAPIKMVNGIPCGVKEPMANGVGCLAAQLVVMLKGDAIGNVYLYPPKSKNCGEEFVYKIEGEGAAPLKITVTTGEYGPKKTLFSGNAEGFRSFCETAKE